MISALQLIAMFVLAGLDFRFGWSHFPLWLTFVAIVLFWAIPLVLGSWVAFFVMLPFPLTLVKRIKNEEQVLSQELQGYKEYMQKVKYRLVPFVW